MFLLFLENTKPSPKLVRWPNYSDLIVRWYKISSFRVAWPKKTIPPLFK